MSFKAFFRVIVLMLIDGPESSTMAAKEPLYL